MYGTRLPYRITEKDRADFYIGGPALTEEMRQQVFESVRTDEHNFSIPPFALVQAIDPDTEDSLLHVAVRAGSMNGVVSLMGRFDRVMRTCGGGPQNPFYIWERHSFIAHQNRDGDTVLHVAARSGNLKLVIMLYRFIYDHWSATCPDLEDLGDEEAPENVEFPETAGEDESSPYLMLLITRNRAGRDAATEARSLGNYEIAEWLDAVANRLDPEGNRRSKKGISDMVRMVKKGFGYTLMAGRKQRETRQTLSNSFSKLQV
ncbi:ankyrin repeat protein [Metarhizium robertsii]|uniref:Ankyrin repeat-containing domain protein n=2 Tax=Metarhizium robertsii TaxID=568076 RepID=E9F947_METRA|nr:Ankyrin repeat-containing domain protein [Metarhizium robertsii ARSEF 23]EFY95815.1 Ankyrin repeat-containing domain protein [Metarhizium robertsii ARSEF 23]EXU95090.1 ankyrin repeat protein [Metarhizium robertsii]